METVEEQLKKEAEEKAQEKKRDDGALKLLGLQNDLAMSEYGLLVSRLKRDYSNGKRLAAVPLDKITAEEKEELERLEDEASDAKLRLINTNAKIGLKRQAEE